MQSFDTDVPAGAYELRLDEAGSLEWIERTSDGEKRHRREPGAGFFKRAWIGLLSLLPIDWLL